MVRAQSQYRLSLGAAGAAFWLVIALFPATLAVVMLFGLLVDPDTLAADIARVSQQAPGSVAEVLAQQAQQVAEQDSGNLSLGLLVALVFTLWSVSAGWYALGRAIRQAYGLGPQNYIAARWRGFLAAVVSVVLLGVLVGGSAIIAGWLTAQSTAVRWTVGVLLALVALILLALGTAGYYRYSIDAPTKWRSLWPGSVITALVVAAILVGLGVFGVYARSYQAIYGALAGIIILMLAVYAAMYSLLLCAVLNAQLAPLGSTESSTSSDAAGPDPAGGAGVAASIH